MKFPGKKIAYSAIATALALSLTACGSDSDSKKDDPVITPDDNDTVTVTGVTYGGDGATDGETRYLADDATYTNLFAHPVRTQAQIDAATELTGDIDTNTTLSAGTLYYIHGLVTVKNNAVLTIPAGTVLFGKAGDDYLVIAKGSKIMAEGEVSNPIVFTSDTALLDPSDADVGQWGGVTVLGNAPTNQTETTYYEVDETNPDFVFGGTVSADNSGILKNIYIYNSGETMGTDQEINGLSLAGVGSGTTVENIHIENSSDDGIEIWGGTVNVTNATLINCQDDSFDLDFGWSGMATNIVVQQTEAVHAGFEISSGGTSPMTSGTIVNFIINKDVDSDEGGIYIKDDTTAPTFINGYVRTYGTDAALYVKKVMTTTQKADIAFKDVILDATDIEE